MQKAQKQLKTDRKKLDKKQKALDSGTGWNFGNFSELFGIFPELPGTFSGTFQNISGTSRDQVLEERGTRGAGEIPSRSRNPAVNTDPDGICGNERP